MNAFVCSVICVVLVGYACGQKAADAPSPISEPIAPQWHAEVSKADGRSITVTVDLKSLSQLKSVNDLRFKVELLDKNGLVKATKELSYTDLSLPALRGGEVYSKTFRLVNVRGVTRVRGISMSGNVQSRVFVYQEPQPDPTKAKT
jgi:hypothetical protein